MSMGNFAVPMILLSNFGALSCSSPSELCLEAPACLDALFVDDPVA
jgi:hypothetical protein